MTVEEMLKLIGKAKRDSSRLLIQSGLSPESVRGVSVRVDDTGASFVILHNERLQKKDSAKEQP